MNSIFVRNRHWRECLLRTWIPIGLFSVLWLDLCRLLSGNWATREQYAYGWFVPFFMVYLLWRRWVERPQGLMETPEVREASPEVCETRSFNVRQPGGRVIVSSFVILAALSLLPMRIIYEVNRDWPFISWPYTIVVVLLTLYAFELAGSQKSSLRPLTGGLAISSSTKYFSFPVCLILLAVVWPGIIEKALTQGLMRIVTSATVSLVNWIGVPAVQHGNVIGLSVGAVGIDEACSGIRSFRSTLMTGIVMGELYLLRVFPRIALVLTGLGLALLLNLARTTWLTMQTARNGMDSLSKWHDRAGWITAVACVLALWAIAGLIKKRSTLCLAEGREKHEASNSSPANLHISNSSAMRLPRFYLLAIGAWTILVLGLNEIWYRSHEIARPNFASWSISLPNTSQTFQSVELSKTTRDLLGYDSGISGKWQEVDGSKWTVYFFQWRGRSAESIMRARYHRPEVCLPAAGMEQTSDSEMDYFEVPSLSLPFQHASYSARGEILYAFYCLWQDGDEFRKGMRTNGRADRLIGPLEGQRHFGQQVLEIVVSGYPDAAETERAVRRRLMNLIQIEPPARTAMSASAL